MKIRTSPPKVYARPDRTRGIDPTRTTMLRRGFAVRLRNLFGKIKADVILKLDEEDALGLEPLVWNAGEWRYLADPEKVKAFQDWLKQQIASRIRNATEDELWRQYVEEGFRRGAGRSFQDVMGRNPDLATTPLDFTAATRQQFLASSFARPVAIEKVKLLVGRTLDELDNVSADMATRMTRTLADGLTQGKSPREVARDIAKAVDISRERALTIAHTELIRAHAEGQLVALENLGVKELGVSVEWSTTGDEKVCPKCRPLEGTVFSLDEAKGLLPRHPRCRCAWIPAGVGEPSSSQKRTRSRIAQAVTRSRRAGRKRGEDAWADDLTISDSRPTPLVNLERRHEGFVPLYELSRIANVFCATGKGGGVDPTCSGTKKIYSVDRRSDEADVLWEQSNSLPNTEAGRQIRDAVRDSTTSELFVIKTDNGIGAAASVFRTETGYKIGHIGSLEKGFGGQILRHIYERADREGREITVEATFSARTFWEKQPGFELEPGSANVFIRSPKPVSNVFCPTGKGGGIDPTCSPNESPMSLGPFDPLSAARVFNPILADTTRTRKDRAKALSAARRQAVSLLDRRLSDDFAGAIPELERLGVSRAADRVKRLTRGMARELVDSQLAQAQERLRDAYQYHHDAKEADRGTYPPIPDPNPSRILFAYYGAAIDTNLARRHDVLDALDRAITGGSVLPRQDREAFMGGDRDELLRVSAKYRGSGTANVFCATGPGGGIDPTCKKGEGGDKGGGTVKPRKSKAAVRFGRLDGSWEETPEDAALSDEQLAVFDRYSRQARVLSDRRVRRQKLRDLFGTDDPAAIASAVAAPDDATVTVYNYPFGHDVKIVVSHPSFVSSRTATIRDGKKVMTNDYFSTTGLQGKGSGFGTGRFAEQVANLKEMGFDRIETWAAKGSGMNGYYTWPRLGYDQPISDFRDPRTRQRIRLQFPSAKTVQDVMHTEFGRQWWKANGANMRKAVFDLKDGSRSLRVLSDYLEEREMQGRPIPQAVGNIEEDQDWQRDNPDYADPPFPPDRAEEIGDADDFTE